MCTFELWPSLRKFASHFESWTLQNQPSFLTAAWSWYAGSGLAFWEWIWVLWEGMCAVWVLYGAYGCCIGAYGCCMGAYECCTGTVWVLYGYVRVLYGCISVLHVCCMNAVWVEMGDV